MDGLGKPVNVTDSFDVSQLEGTLQQLLARIERLELERVSYWVEVFLIFETE